MHAAKLVTILWVFLRRKFVPAGWLRGSQIELEKLFLAGLSVLEVACFVVEYICLQVAINVVGCSCVYLLVIESGLLPDPTLTILILLKQLLRYIDKRPNST